MNDTSARRALEVDLTSARPGDERAFTHLIDPLEQDLRAHCNRMLGVLDDADDALADASVRAWRGLGGFEGRSSLRTWL